jgi:hypothetical protein
MISEATKPAKLTQAAAEDQTWGVDTSPQLTTGQTIGSYTTALVQENGPPITLTDPPSLVGNVILQRVRANLLSVGHTYDLRVLFQINGTTNQQLAILQIACDSV